MLINNKKQMLGVIAVALSTLTPQFARAEESASQALQQLRMLQQQMLQKRGDTKSQQAAKSESKTPQTTNSDENKKPVTRGKYIKPDYSSNKSSKPAPLSQQEVISQLAFKQVKDRLFPLSPDETLRVHQQYNTNEFALAATPGTPPRPTATTQIVNLSPGSTPPVIRLAQGFVSSVVFLDSTGAPWPIVAYDVGDPSSFNIQWDKSGNTLMMQAVKLYNYGNMAIKLEGLNTPVMLTLVPGQKAVDYRVDMRVQGYGPNAKAMPTGMGLPESADSALLKVLDGVPPAGANRLMVKGGPAKAWVVGEKMFVRTALTILSPGWISMMTSADGTHAYEMIKAPVLLVSWHGKVMQLKLEGL